MTHRVITLIFLVIIVAVGVSATTLPPFTGAPGILPPAGVLPTGNKLATVATKFSFGTPQIPNKNTGTVTEWVYQDTSHHDYLFFVFQIVVTGGSRGDIDRLSIGDWDNSVYIDATQYAPGNDKTATSVDRNGLGTIGINWALPLVKGQSSSFVILYTHSTEYAPGTIGLIDSGSSPSLPGYVALPTPEPASLSLLLFGVPALLIKRKFMQRRIAD